MKFKSKLTKISFVVVLVCSVVLSLIAKGSTFSSFGSLTDTGTGTGTGDPCTYNEWPLNSYTESTNTQSRCYYCGPNLNAPISHTYDSAGNITGTYYQLMQNYSFVSTVDCKATTIFAKICYGVKLNASHSSTIVCNGSVYVPGGN